MILLALDTCDSRGSVAIWREGQPVQAVGHSDAADYSSWILPTAEKVLMASGLGMRDVDVLAVASGPGSFTGVRVGLTTVKAWSEVYGKPIASVSRLEAMASESPGNDRYVAAFVDAHRGQVFGGLYRRQSDGPSLVEDEMVTAPEAFLNWVEEHAAGEPISWISLDPEKVTTLEIWAVRAKQGEFVHTSTSLLAPAIGKLGRQRALEGRLTDALALDADYVRRSDAEICWKARSSRGS